MPRLELTRATWQAVARELSGPHAAAAPPGLVERIRTLVAESPRGWPEQTFVLELDEGSAEAVRAVHAALRHDDPDAGQRAASVSEAVRVIHDHQTRG